MEHGAQIKPDAVDFANPICVFYYYYSLERDATFLAPAEGWFKESLYMHNLQGHSE
jgi:hypothetical protein